MAFYKKANNTTDMNSKTKKKTPNKNRKGTWSTLMIEKKKQKQEKKKVGKARTQF